MKSSTFLILLLAITLPLINCKKVKVRKSSKKTSTVKAIGSTMTGAVVATGAYLVTSEMLMKSFNNPTSRDPIFAEFKNSDLIPVELKFTTNGKDWNTTTLNPHDTYGINSYEVGIVGVKCNDQYLKVDQSNYFTINNNGGTINFYGH